MSKEAMKLALAALEYIHEGANNQGPHTGISWRCVSNKAESAITALREALAEPDFWEGYVPEPDKRQQALDKKAENARELGLDYEPAQYSDIVSNGGFDPRTQRTWVGLTDEERNECTQTPFTADQHRAIEAKLKEKNT